MLKQQAIISAYLQLYNETPMVRGLAADNNNKLYTETMIFLWNTGIEVLHWLELFQQYGSREFACELVFL